MTSSLGSAEQTARQAGTFNRIVVPVADEASYLRVAEAAARIAAPAATVVLVFVLEVSRELPLDALFHDEEAAARELLRRAAVSVEQFGLRVVQRLVRAHAPAAEILELAHEYRADLIMLAAPGRSRRGRAGFGRTVTSVLQRAPCRVILVRPGQRGGSRRLAP